MDKIEKAVRAAVQGCDPHYCGQAADLLGIGHPDCFECGGDECDACAERVADAMAAHLMPEGIQWPLFEDGEPVRIGDEAADDTDGFESVGAVRIDKDGWTLLNEWRTYIDYGGFGATATRYTPPAPEPTDAVRCADCRYARRLAQNGLVCSIHGEAGWFATDADGFCHRGERR